MSRDPKFFLHDILDSSAKVLAYAKGRTQEEFEASGMAYDAVIRNLEVRSRVKITCAVQVILLRPLS